MVEHPSVENLIGLLRKCRQENSIEQARCLHALLCEQDLENNPILGNYLVPALVDCGSLPDAEHTFSRLHQRSEHSWSSLISGYVDSGNTQHAFHLYRIMQGDSHADPSKFTYLALLRASSKLEDLGPYHCIHASIVCRGLDTDLFVGNTLVDVYAKCGLLIEARHVFDNLPTRDVVSCNALIAGYADYGFCEDGLACFTGMELEDISPDTVTFVSTLKLCGSTGAVGESRHLQAEIIKRGFECDLFIRNALVYAYAKCGCLYEAQHLLNKVCIRDVVSWNALMAGYAESGHGEQVLHCFEQMQKDGIMPDDTSFVCSLKACGLTGALVKGTEIHTLVVKIGLEHEVYPANTLVDMYAKCGSLAEASKLVDQISSEGVVAWTSLVTGYIEKGLNDEGLSCYERMQEKGILPDANILVCIVQACCCMKSIRRGLLLSVEIAKRGLETDLFVGSAMVDMYAKCGLLMDAKETLKRLPSRNVVCWTALVCGYAEHGFGEEALNSYKQMQLENILPVEVTYACSLKACGIIGALETGREMHFELTKRGLESELYVGNTLVDMYAKNKSLDEAQGVFDKLPIHNVVTWTALIAGYGEGGLNEQVLSSFDQMQIESVVADAITFIYCLKACSTTGALEKGREIHAEIRKSGLESDLFLGNTLIDMYGKCGSLAEAQEVFDRLPVQDVVSWNALITAYGENHEGNMALQCFEDMQEQGVKPDAATFTCLFIACSHASLIDKGQEFLKLMSEGHEIEPIPHHYSCMVDLLARSGHVFEAQRFVEALQSSPSKEVLTALLTGCKVYGEVELGERCFEELVQVNPEDAAAYLLMADIYAMSGRWEDVQRIEEMRKISKAGINKGQ